MTEQNATTAEQAKQFARDYPYIASGALLTPVTYGITGDPTIALFAGGAVAFGPYIAEGLNDADLGNETDADGDSDE